MDPALPMHKRGRPAAMTFGKFIDFDDTVKLVDRHGNVYALEYVQIVTGFWGFDEDGQAKLPRPFKYVPGTDQILIKGDMVCIFFLDGNPHRPVVMGAVRSFKGGGEFEIPSTYDFSSTDGKKASQDVLKGRLQVVDQTLGDVGRSSGADEVRWSVNEYADGVVDVQASGYTVARHVDQPANELEWAMMAETFLAALQTSLVELMAAPTALGLPTTQTQQLIANIVQSLAAQAPYLSTAQKVGE